MELIECQRCRNIIGDTVDNCPYCGYILHNRIETCPNCKANVIVNDSNFCSQCGTQLLNTKSSKDKPKINKKIKIVVLIIILIFIICISIVGLTYYNDYKKQRLFEEIQQESPEITLSDLALEHNCSIENLTIQHLETSLENIKQYNKEQDEYDLVYNSSITESKKLCTSMIKNAVFVDNMYAMFNSYNNSSYHFTPINESVEVYTIAEIDEQKETLKKIGMTINYPCSITRYEVVISTGKTEIHNESGIIAVCGQVDLTTNEVSIYYIGAFTPDGSLIKEDGDFSSWIYTFSKPLVKCENKNGIVQNIYEMDTSQDTTDDLSQNNDLLDESNTPTSNYKPIEITDTTGINGIYTDKAYALASNGGYGSSYSTYKIQNGKIEYCTEGSIYQGTYIQDNDKLIITYTNAYEGDYEYDEFDIVSDELTIINENKLIKNFDWEFIKE